MQRSIATVSLSGTLPEKLEAIAAAGFDGVEIFENDLLYYDGSPRNVRQICADLGIAITLFQPFRDFEGCRRDRLQRNVDRAERKFDLGRNAHRVVIGRASGNLAGRVDGLAHGIRVDVRNDPAVGHLGADQSAGLPWPVRFTAHGIASGLFHPRRTLGTGSGLHLDAGSQHSLYLRRAVCFRGRVGE